MILHVGKIRDGLNIGYGVKPYLRLVLGVILFWRLLTSACTALEIHRRPHSGNERVFLKVTPLLPLLNRESSPTSDT